MAGNAPTPLHPVDSDAHTDTEDDRIAAFDDAEDGEHAKTPTADRRWGLPPVNAAPYMTTVLCSLAAVLFGGMIGYWFGVRRSQQPVKKIKHAASTVGHAAELLPVLTQFLANPVIRTLAIRLLMRRFAR